MGGFSDSSGKKIIQFRKASAKWAIIPPKYAKAGP
jgi:hypothetical protein